MSANRYIRFVELSSGLIRDSRIPLFSSKFSKKTYTQHQLLILLLLKEYLSEDYRDTVELTEIMDSLREKIHLDEVPISRRSISSVNGFDPRHSPGYSTGSLNSFTTGVRELLAPRSIRRVLPVPMPVHIIPGEPGKPENDS